MLFKYRGSILDFETGEQVWQPMLRVKVLPREGFLPFPTEMIVDSGATDTLLDGKIGESLGIDVKSGRQKSVGGITGGATGYFHHVQIELVDLDDTLDIEVGFVYDMGAGGLLGQVDFFSRYYANFDGRKREFELTKMPELNFD